MIWYRRNAVVTSLVDSATSSASAAGTVAGTVVSGAGSMASSVLQPLVFDPLRRLQGTDENTEILESDRLWVAVDGMGGDHAPGPILEPEGPGVHPGITGVTQALPRRYP